MLLGFKPQFAPFVEDGSKTHTIRACRKVPPKVGETCHCYTGLRQKGARLLGRFECVKVEDIGIFEVWEFGKLMGTDVYVNGSRLDSSELELLAWRDGFRYPVDGTPKSGYSNNPTGCFYLMLRFWKGRLPFRGQIIHWKFTKGTNVK